MKRFIAGMCAVLVLTACSGQNNASENSIAPETQSGKCAPQQKNPWLGLAAISDTYRVQVWDDPVSNTPRELEQIGDDPFAENSGYDLTVVESVAVSQKDCTIFVGACCEPVSGITYYQGTKEGEWLQLMGHLPAVSPDGELLALVAYEELIVSATQSPDKVQKTFALPKANEATIYKSTWLNGDQVALSGFTPQGAYVWIATLSEGTVGPGQLITDEVNWESENLWRTGLVGYDEFENLVTRSAGSGTTDVLDFRYVEARDSHSTN